MMEISEGETLRVSSLPMDFDAFFDAHSRDLYAALVLVTRDRHEAEEIAQEALVRVWERWDRVARMDSPDGYLFRTGMNVLRSRKRRASVALRRAVHLMPVEDGIAAIDDNAELASLLADLTPRQRAAIVLTDVLGLTSEEAAQILHIRSSTVRVLAVRGREVLRPMLEERKRDPDE